MKAAWYEKYGTAKEVFQIGELPDPQAGPGEVLVRLHTSGVNPTDWKSRMGSRGAFTFDRIVPHHDGAGVIEAVGAGVDASRAGQRVWVYGAQYGRPMGTAAQYVALPQEQAAWLPDRVSFEEGACLGVPALTAHRCLMADGPVTGLDVLVTGGAGAVGHYGIQLAKWGGAANIIATVSSDEKAAHAVAAGATHTINYRTEDVAARVMEITGGKGVERVVEVDFGGNIGATPNLIAMNATIGCYASTGNREPSFVYQEFSQRSATVRFVTVFRSPADAIAQGVADVNQAIEDGALQHAIAERYTLDDIVAAHESQEASKIIGNIVIAIP